MMTNKEAAVKAGFIAASRRMFDQQLAAGERDGCVRAMKDAGLEPVVPDGSIARNGLITTAAEARAAGRMFADAKVDCVVIGALNFGEEIPAAIAALEAGREVPVMLFGVGEEGELTPETSRRDSFCGLISIATALRHRQVRFVFPHTAVTDTAGNSLAAAFSEFASAARAVKAVRGATYGQFGPRPANFETCAFDELSLLRQLGIRVVPVPLTTLFAATAKAREKNIRETYAAMEKQLDRSSVSDFDLAKMARLEVALMTMIEELGLDALGLQCWTSIQEEYGISPCFVMSRLIDRGIPCACEVDIHGALSMHLLSEAAGSPAALADWNNRHYAEPDIFSAWHCGVFPASMASGGCNLGCHEILARDTGSPEGKYGTVELQVEPGPLTIARVTEHPGDEWPVLVAEGEVVEAPGRPFGSNAWVRVSDLDTLYGTVLRGFPHHAAIVRGHHAPALLAAAYFLGLEPVVPLEVTRGHIDIGPGY